MEMEGKVPSIDNFSNFQNNLCYYVYRYFKLHYNGKIE